MATKPKKTDAKKEEEIKTLTTDENASLREDMIAKETPYGLPIDPKTGRQVPAPREVSGDAAVPDSDQLPTMIGTTIITGGTQ